MFRKRGGARRADPKVLVSTFRREQDTSTETSLRDNIESTETKKKKETETNTRGAASIASQG